MNSPNAVIQTENLSKVYHVGRKDIPALKNLNLGVQRGEIFGYLGPNGAGKTTTIRLLLDLIRPTSGSAHVLGMDAQNDSVNIHRHIGFLPGELNLWKNLTGQQVVDYIGRLRGGVNNNDVRTLTGRLELDLNIRVRNYSSGNKRKLGLVIALMNKPDLLILDEPTGGLDPLMQQTFNQMMHEARADGQTVFLSSHVLSEVQAICDRVGILRGGELKAVERVSDLTHRDFRWVTLKFNEPVQPAFLSSVSGASEITAEGKTIKLRLTGDFDPLLRAINSHYVADIEVQEPSLEEIFLAFYDSHQSNSVSHRKQVQS